MGTKAPEDTIEYLFAIAKRFHQFCILHSAFCIVQFIGLMPDKLQVVYQSNTTAPMAQQRQRVLQVRRRAGMVS